MEKEIIVTWSSSTYRLQDNRNLCYNLILIKELIMRVFNQDKTVELTEYDLAKGYLVDDELVTEHEAEIVHHPAVKAVEEQSHYEVIAEYPNGGKDVEKIIDVEAIEAKDAYDEVIKEAHIDKEPIHIYIPYTTEEIAKRKAISLRSQLENYLSNTDYAVIKCKELGLDIDTEYPNLLQKRQQARDRINQIDSEYPEIRAKATEFPL